MNDGVRMEWSSHIDTDSKGNNMDEKGEITTASTKWHTADGKIDEGSHSIRDGRRNSPNESLRQGYSWADQYDLSYAHVFMEDTTPIENIEERTPFIQGMLEELEVVLNVIGVVNIIFMIEISQKVEYKVSLVK